MSTKQPLAPGAFITQLMKSGFKRHGPVTSDEDFETHHLDLTSLKLDVGVLAPFLIPKKLAGHSIIKAEQLSEILPDLDKATRSLQKKLAVLTVGGKLMRLDKQVMDDLGVLGVAIIDRSTIDAVAATDDWAARAKIISTVLVQFLGREILSPYVSGRPAVGGRFFGRSSTVKDMLSSPGSFTIVGNRRIGKTSLLKEIRERLKLQNVRTGEIYGATCSSTQDVVYKLLKSLDRFRDAEHILTEPQRARNLASYVQRISDAEKRSVVVFIDEFDRILEFDEKQDYEVLNLLRETFEGHQSCRVFIAGFRKTIEVKMNLKTPYFNFTTSVPLPLFKTEETFEMVTRPLHRLGIEVEGTDLPAAIYQETGGHPELIQIHCRTILQYFQKHKSVPTGAQLLTEVFNTEEYRQKVLGAFLSNTNSHEALLCYLLFADAEKTEHPSEYEFESRDVKRVFDSVDIKFFIPEITAIITNLKHSGIISQVGGVVNKYRFSAPQLVNYCVGLDLDFCIEATRERLKLEGQTLWHEPDASEEPIIFTV